MSSSKTALILTGGGARAAYQVGVLAAVREMLPDPARNPFPILCGTSAGAINAAAVAVGAEDFGAAVHNLRRIWESFHAGDIYRADPIGIAASGASWLSALALGWFVRKSPRSLLDTSPLRRMLAEHIDLSRLESAIANHALHSVSITCSGYASGESVSFFQGRQDIEPWRRTQRIGAHVKLDVEHLMASSAIPFIFPAVKLNREYFGDGSMRQLSPISPAIHMGAERVLVIGPGRMEDMIPRRHADRYPSLAQIAGHALSSIFLDSLSVDLERMKRINHTMSLIPDSVKRERHITLRKIDILVIAPSQRLDHMAARHAKSLPWPVRAMLRGVGAMNRYGGALTSYLLFEPPYTGALIDLGYQDTMVRRSEVEDFLRMAPAANSS
jgi:NTE family protein